MNPQKRLISNKSGRFFPIALTRTSLLAGLLTLACSSAALALPVDKLIDEAAGQYKNGSYGPATVTLLEALRDAPHNAEAHYYLANCYIFLKREPEAVEEYRAAMQWGGNSEIANYSKQALINLGVLPGGSGSPATAVHPSDVGHSLTEIGRQAEQSADIIQRQAEGASRDIRQIGTEHARTVEIHGAQRVNDMANSYITDKWGNQMPLYSDDQIAAARDHYQNRAQALRDQTRQNIQNLQRESQQHQDLTRQSAADLANQLQQPTVTTDGAKLVPQGTNLYIRNYSK